jgi:archaellum component FlaC
MSKKDLRKLKKEIDTVQTQQEVVSNNLTNLKDVPPHIDLSGFDRIDTLTVFSDI